MGIAPGTEATRVLALCQGRTLLKAHLDTTPNHPRALQWLLEAVALWQGTRVRCVLCADGGVGGRVTSLYRDYFADFGGPLYALEYGEHLRDVARRADRLGMSGDFSDLRQLHLSDLLSQEGSR
jgi:hypothetical protein